MLKIKFYQLKSRSFWFKGGAACLLLIAVLVTACTSSGISPNGRGGNDGENNTLQVSIMEPTANEILLAGETVKVLSTSEDTRGINRVELLINGEVIQIDANPQPESGTPYTVAQLWTPDETGLYTIEVQAYNTANLSEKSQAISVKVEAQTETKSTSTPNVNLPVLTTTATLTPEPTATNLPPSPTVAEEPTPEPLEASATFEATGFEPKNRFREIWLTVGGGEGKLGYPTAPEIDGRDFAYQHFEGGLMYWWSNPDGEGFIWVMEALDSDFTQGSAWNRYEDHWQDSDPYSCDEARKNGEAGPIRGFGKLWCEETDLMTTLGNPTRLEAGSGGNVPFSIVQFYQGGVMLYNPLAGEVYILFNNSNWQRMFY